MKNNKEQKAEPAAGESTDGTAVRRSRYMQENKKAKTFQGLFCAAQDFSESHQWRGCCRDSCIRFQMRE
jgi:hypothetical protein